MSHTMMVLRAKTSIHDAVYGFFFLTFFIFVSLVLMLLVFQYGTKWNWLCTKCDVFSVCCVWNVLDTPQRNIRKKNCSFEFLKKKNERHLICLQRQPIFFLLLFFGFLIIKFTFKNAFKWFVFNVLRFCLL